MCLFYFSVFLFPFIRWTIFPIDRPFYFSAATRTRIKILNSKKCVATAKIPFRLGIWYQCVYRMNIDTVLNRHSIVIFANALRRRVAWRHRLKVDECKGQNRDFPVHGECALWCINRKCFAPWFLNENSIFETSTVLFAVSPTDFYRPLSAHAFGKQNLFLEINSITGSSILKLVPSNKESVGADTCTQVYTRAHSILCRQTHCSDFW